MKKEIAVNDTGIINMDDLYETVGYRMARASKDELANAFISRVSDAAYAAASSNEVKKGFNKNVKYVVDMSEDMIKAVENRTIKLDQNRAGQIFAQVRNASGEYGSKIPIKKEVVLAGINPVMAVQLLQMKVIEEKLDTIMDTMKEIGQDIAGVLQGQQNDRIGLFNSGLNMYLESKSIQDTGFKKLVLSQAIKSLSDSNEQLALEMRVNLDYLLEGQYKNKKGKSLEDINEKMNNINKCFDIIHRCYLLKSEIYFECNELPAMISVFDEYSKYLKTAVVPYSEILTEFDSTDVLLVGGKWEKRAKLFDGLCELKQQIADNKTFYIGIEGVDNGKRQACKGLPKS